MIHIVDYGAGNVGSIINMVKRIGGNAKLTSDAKELEKAEKVILPGVGHFDFGMQMLKKSELISTLNFLALEKKVNILGICLGAQMMCNGSEEGSEKGLGWFDAEVKRFPESDLTVPHMGWNHVVPQKKTALSSFEYEQRFYFVHTYYMLPKDSKDIMYKTSYGIDFTSALQKDNLYACQFHPEKSHKYGYEILKAFNNI